MPLVPFYTRICLVCWKKFLAPYYYDQVNNKYIYFDSKVGEFRTFLWQSNELASQKLDEVLAESEELQFRNDDSKGNIAKQIIGIIADGGNWKVVYNKTSCPRCGLNFSLRFSTVASIKEIEELNFNNINKLQNRSIIEKAKLMTNGA